MDKFHDADLTDGTLYRGAMRTSLRLSALLVDLFDNVGATKVVNAGFSELFEVLAALLLGQQDLCAVLADILQN